MSSNLSDWWESLSTLQQIYWGIAVPSTLLFLLQTILTFVGGDMDAEMEHDVSVESDHGVGFQFFTFKNFIAFFTIFSWTGITCLNIGFSTGLTILVSTLAGIAMMGLMAGIFYYFSKLSDSGTMKMKNAIGQVGEVYLTVNANRGNIGKVSIKVQGALRELDALTDGDTDLPMGTVIQVDDLINDNLLLISKSKK